MTRTMTQTTLGVMTHEDENHVVDRDDDCKDNDDGDNDDDDDDDDDDDWE